MPSSSTVAPMTSVKPSARPASAAAKPAAASAKPATPAPAKPAPASAVATPAKAAASSASSPSSIVSPSLAAAMGSAPKAGVATAATGPASTAASLPLAAASSGGGFVTSGGRVTVDIAASDSGYENQIYWSSDNFATRHLLGVDNDKASIDLGEFAAGTRIDFGIVNGANQFFRTGGSTANGDGVDHARISSNAQGTQIGFEDLLGGGDRDFNDAIIQIRSSAAVPAPAATDLQGILSAKPPASAVAPLTGNGSGSGSGRPLGGALPATIPALPAAPVKTSAPPPPVTPAAAVPKNDNRSGLGDGTNPGQGAGTAKSPNTGTLNPSQAASPKATAAVKPAPAKPAATPTVAAPDPVAKKTTPAAVPIVPTQAKLEATKQLLASSYNSLAPTPAPAPAAAPAPASEKAKVGKTG